MKNIEKLAIKKAYRILYVEAIRGRHNLLDRRFNVNKLAYRLLPKLRLNFPSDSIIREKRKHRINNKNYQFTNILNNKLVKDYLSNYNQIKFIASDHIHFFSNRNHWAKNSKDIRILKVLKKYFKQTKK